VYKMLSYPIALDNPTIPGNPETKFEKLITIEEGNLFNTSYISFCTHNDSHIDAPGHFNKDGITVDKISPEEFFFHNVQVVDVSDRPGLEITLKDLGNVSDNTDLILIYSGQSKNWKTPAYTDKSLQPWLADEAAEVLLQRKNLRAVGIDFFCIDKLENIEQKQAPVHQMFCGINSLNKTILIYENLKVEPALNEKVIKVYAFPLQLAGIDGSPVTVVAEVK